MRKLVVLCGIVALSGNVVLGHCQVPCGIYGDETRFSLLLEHVGTIRKSIAEIDKESRAVAPNQNQLVRWVANKENHADEIKEIAAEYFLAQRVKDSQNGYTDMLKALHRVIVSAMKTKQSLDSANADALEKAILDFRALYEKR